MKKFVLIHVLALILINANAQKYITRNGHIGFFSHTIIEDIKADNNEVASILDTSSGGLVFQVAMKSFHFEKSLMEEHFNENYVESDKFPKSTFNGKITNLSDVDFSKPGKYNVKVEGDMVIHGVSRKVSADGTIEVLSSNINAESLFLLNPEDYGISIPGIVRDKIANNLEITVKMNYSAM